jgi:hypothetical protein
MWLPDPLIYRASVGDLRSDVIRRRWLLIDLDPKARRNFEHRLRTRIEGDGAGDIAFHVVTTWVGNTHNRHLPDEEQ